jgi:hypothetical protein
MLLCLCLLFQNSEVAPGPPGSPSDPEDLNSLLYSLFFFLYVMALFRALVSKASVAQAQVSYSYCTN